MRALSKLRSPGAVSGASLVRAVVVALGLAVVVSLGAWSCAWQSEGLDPTTMPPTVQPDYALFAQRCSKCHSLARPLTSGIDEDAYWVDYVARMRRQPASGISAEDTVGILRFLHYFSIEEKKKHGKIASVEVVTPGSVGVVVTAPVSAPAGIVPSAAAPTPAPPPPQAPTKP